LKNLNISEEELRSSFVDAYKNTQEIKLHLEVPVFCRSVDLVIQDAKQASITAMEFKIHDWKRAILQVQSVALCFDYLYICIPKPKTQKGYQSVVGTCQANGVGLYFFDVITNTFEKSIDSPKTETVWNTQRRRIIGYLEAKENERNT
jgi:hypothetical protein